MPLIEISMLEGRTSAQKKKLIHDVTHTVVSSIGAPIESIRVVIREVPLDHWGVGGVTKDEDVKK